MLRAHALQRLGEAHVALDAVATHAFDAHRPAADRAGSEKIRCAGSIAFDMYLARTDDSAASAGIVNAAQPLRVDLDTESRHQVERDFDVRLRNQFAFDFDRRVARRSAATPSAAPSGTGWTRRRARSPAGTGAIEPGRISSGGKPSLPE